MHSVLLGSSSPRRREILRRFSLPFEVASPPFDESTIPFEGDPESYVRRIANGKAESLAPSHQGKVILTADTIVFHNGQPFGKPSSREEAFRTLSRLSGVWHTVYTAVCGWQGAKRAMEVTRTEILFRQLTADQIYRYLDAVGWKDKAAGYAIQGSGYMIIEGIEGCFYNAMGLPIQALTNVLRHLGVDLWDYLPK